jgi:tyrosine-protein kinase Etk/Wzc
MAQEEIGLQHYADILWRRKWIVLSVFTVVFCMSAIWISMSKTVYRVHSLVGVRNQLFYRQPILPFAPGTDRADLSLHGESYVQVINGLPFAEKVANALSSKSIPAEPDAVHGSLNAEFREPDLILIHATHIDKEMAVEYANTAAETFVSETKDSVRAEMISAAQFLQGAMEQSARQMNEYEGEITRFKEGLGFVNINDEIMNLKATITAFEKERATIATQIEVADTHRKEILNLAKISNAEAVSIPMDDPQIEDYRKLQSLLAESRIKYTDQHPVVQAVQQQMREIESKMRSSLAATGSSLSPERWIALREDLAKTDSQRADLRTALDSWDRQIQIVKDRLADFPQKQNRLEDLQAKSAEAQARYKSIRDKLDSINIQKEMVQGNASVVDLAKAPLPATRKTTNLTLAFIVSLMLSLGLAFIAEFADTTVRSPEEISRTMNLGYLGSIVRLKEPRAMVFEGGKVSHQVAEAYTRIYSSIKFAAVEGALRSVLITSARKGEGKSTTLVNLSCAIAASGKRVVIVDVDLRNPSLQRILGSRHKSGLTSVLAGEVGLSEMVRPTAHPNLHILPSGPIPPNPAELIQSLAMKEVINELQTKFDLVILDSPPTLLVADAMLLAGEVDAAIIVTESGGVTRKEVLHVRDALQLAKTRVLGIILNKVQESPGSYYYNYYSHYRYYQQEPEEKQAEPVGAVGWLRESVKSLGSRSGRT